MKKIDWASKALQSEIEYFKALGGKAIEYHDFIHIYNKLVPLNGDYNLAINIKISDYNSLNKIIDKIEFLHQEKKLDIPNNFYISPPILNNKKWKGYLEKLGYEFCDVYYFRANSENLDTPSEYKFYSPTDNEYFQWFTKTRKSEDWYDEDTFQMTLPSQVRFYKIFKPYWFYKNNNMIGWIYCADLGEDSRLFDVFIKEEYRRQGMGTIMLKLIRTLAYNNGSSVVLTSVHAIKRLRKFYESAGFVECSSNSLIMRKRK